MPLPSGYIDSQAVWSNGKRLVHPIKTVKQTFTNPAAAVTNGVSASHLGQAAAGTVFQTLGGSLATGGVATMDFPRNVVITVTHASSVVAMSGTITGYDEYGTLITESWSVAATGTSKTFTGKKAFKTVVAITETVAADASANTIISGSGAVLGLDHYSEVASLLKETSAGSVVTNGTLTAAGTTNAADARGTYTPNSAPNGSTTYVVYYLTPDLVFVK